jgi:hypothetical protein
MPRWNQHHGKSGGYTPLIEAVPVFKNEYHQGERQMGIQKKNSPKNLQNEAEEADKEKKFDSLFGKASNGDTEAMITLLAKSGRGYEMSEADLAIILHNRQEGI